MNLIQYYVNVYTERYIGTCEDHSVPHIITHSMKPQTTQSDIQTSRPNSSKAFQNPISEDSTKW